MFRKSPCTGSRYRGSRNRKLHLWPQKSYVRNSDVCLHFFRSFTYFCVVAFTSLPYWFFAMTCNDGARRHHSTCLRTQNGHMSRAGLIPNLAWCCCPDKGLFSSRHSRQTKTLATQPPFTECGYIKHHYSSMVQFGINSKLSTINGKGLNRLIDRKETRNSAVAERQRCRVGLRRNVCCSS